MLVFHNIEENEANRDGDALTLYFDSMPTVSEVEQTCRDTAGKHNISADVKDPSFSWDVCETPVSARAGLVRVQVYPCG